MGVEKSPPGLRPHLAISLEELAVYTDVGALEMPHGGLGDGPEIAERGAFEVALGLEDGLDEPHVVAMVAAAQGAWEWGRDDDGADWIGHALTSVSNNSTAG